ncbi:MAG: polysaccharide deacetylase family protein [Acidimicrobiales bacterium]
MTCHRSVLIKGVAVLAGLGLLAPACTSSAGGLPHRSTAATQPATTGALATTTTEAPVPTTTQPPTTTTTEVQAAQPVPASLVGAEWDKVPTTRHVVALTFDCGSNDAGVGSILATLQATHTPATFFMTGVFAQTYPSVAKEIGASHPIGNHTYNHMDLTKLSEAQVREELLRAQSIILQTTGHHTRPLFRFPYGARDSRTIQLVNGLGYGDIYWTVDTLGWEGKSNGASVPLAISRVMAQLQPGEIVLQHCGAANDGTTIDAHALQAIIQGVEARGYSFVTLEQFVGP